MPDAGKDVNVGLLSEEDVPMLRQAFADRLKQALKARDLRTVSTTRLILAELKDRDLAARGEGRPGVFPTTKFGKCCWR